MVQGPFEHLPRNLWALCFSFLEKQKDLNSAGCVNKRLHQAQLQHDATRARFCDLLELFNLYSDNTLPISSDSLGQIKNALASDDRSLGQIKKEVLENLIESQNEKDCAKTQEIKNAALVIVRYFINGKEEDAYQRFKMIPSDDWACAAPFILPWVAAFGHVAMLNDLCSRLEEAMQKKEVPQLWLESINDTFALDWACRFGHAKAASVLVKFYPGWCHSKRASKQPQFVDNLFATDDATVMEAVLPAIKKSDLNAANKLLLEAFKHGASRMSVYLMEKGSASVFDYVIYSDREQLSSVLYQVMSIMDIAVRVKAYWACQQVYGDVLTRANDGFYLLLLAMGGRLVDEVKRILPTYQQAGIDISSYYFIVQGVQYKSILSYAVYSGSAEMVQYLMDPIGLQVQKPLRPDERLDDRQRKECGFLFTTTDLNKIIALEAGRTPNPLSFFKALLPFGLLTLTDPVFHNDDLTLFEHLLRVTNGVISEEDMVCYGRILYGEILDKLRSLVINEVDNYLHDRSSNKNTSQGIIWARDLRAKLTAANSAAAVVRIMYAHLTRKKLGKKAGLKDESLDTRILTSIRGDDVLNRFLFHLLHGSRGCNYNFTIARNNDHKLMYPLVYCDQDTDKNRKATHEYLISYLEFWVSNKSQNFSGLEQIMLASDLAQERAQQAMYSDETQRLVL